MQHPLAANIIGLYERHAAAWRQRRNPEASLEVGWLKRFIEQLPPGAEVLDLGCGTGQPLAAWLVEHGFEVTGIDTSAAMIAFAQERQPTQRWVQADMRTLQLGQRFRGILAWDSFFHLSPDDRLRGAGVRVGRPGLWWSFGMARLSSARSSGGQPNMNASLLYVIAAPTGVAPIAFVGKP